MLERKGREKGTSNGKVKGEKTREGKEGGERQEKREQETEQKVQRRRFDTVPTSTFIGTSVQAVPARDALISPATIARRRPSATRWLALSLGVSAPVIPTEIRPHLGAHQDLANGRTEYDPWDKRLRVFVRSGLPTSAAKF